MTEVINLLITFQTQSNLTSNTEIMLLTNQVLFKMDKSGHGEEFQYSDLVRNKDLNFTNFTKQMVLEMCIMSGCDYLPSLPGMGVKRAHGLMRRFKSYEKVENLKLHIPCILRKFLSFKNNLSFLFVPDNLRQKFRISTGYSTPEI